MKDYEWINRLVLATLAFGLGYVSPRDLELESTAPVVFEYSITKEAADLLVRKQNTHLMECQP